jgi:glutamate N-acetyltransferase/amino-acid N-acetyltransferase
MAAQANGADFQQIKGGVTAPRGFLAAGVAAAVKVQGRRDVAMLFSTVPAQAAAVYTTNKVVAAPVLLTREHLSGGRARAVVANSGYANACTGERGLADVRREAELAAELLGIAPGEVIVASTG